MIIAQATAAGELVEQFHRDGFVHVPSLLPVDEIDAFKAVVDEAVARRTRHDTRAFEERTPYQQIARQCLYLWLDSPGVRPLDFHPALTGFAAALLGAERVRLWHDQAIYKEPGGRETEAHQDHAYWPVAETDMVSAWVPLVDVDDEMGCMGYIPGTHTSERQFVNIFTQPGEGNAFAARHAPPVWVTANRGDVIFHAARTIHMAKPNRSKHLRAVHTAVYFRDGCTWLPGDPMGRNDFRAGARIEGPATPIAWPLPPGEIPTPPRWDTVALQATHLTEIGMMPSLDEP